MMQRDEVTLLAYDIPVTSDHNAADYITYHTHAITRHRRSYATPAMHIPQ